MKCNARQIELQNQVSEQQQKINTNEELQNKNETNGKNKAIIQLHENRLQKLEAQLGILMTPTSTKRKRLNLRVSRIANLTPTARKLYDITLKLKRRNCGNTNFISLYIKGQHTV